MEQEFGALGRAGEEVAAVLKLDRSAVVVTLVQKARGGITITASA